MSTRIKTTTILFSILAIGLAACSSETAITSIVQASSTEQVEVIDTEENTYLPTVVTDIGSASTEDGDLTYPIVDTNQQICYNDSELIDHRC